MRLENSSQPPKLFHWSVHGWPKLEIFTNIRTTWKIGVQFKFKSVNQTQIDNSFTQQWKYQELTVRNKNFLKIISRDTTNSITLSLC